MDLIRYENNSIDKNNAIKEKVLDELALATNNELGITLRDILLHPNSQQYKKEILSILEKYNFNIYDFYNETLIDLATENNIDFTSLTKGLFIKEITKDGLFVIMKTVHETFRIALLAEFSKDKHLLNYKLQYELVCDCHKHTTWLLESKGLTAITALCKMDFNGYYLHSYNVIEKTGLIWDASHNLIMAEDQYNKLFNPIIINKLTKDNYYQSDDYKNYTVGKEFPVFTLALKKAKKMRDVNV